MPKLIPFEIVQELVGGLSQPTIWRMRRDKKFPEPVAISPNRIAWRESDIDMWVKCRTVEPPEALAPEKEAKPAA